MLFLDLPPVEFDQIGMNADGRRLRQWKLAVEHRKFEQAGQFCL